MRAASCGAVVAAGLLAAGWLTGCATVESTSLLGAEEQGVGSTEERGERKAVLEVTVPEPAYVAEEAALQSAWREADYESDRKRTFRAFEAHAHCPFSLDQFKALDRMMAPPGPFIDVALREKQKITVSKTHEVVTRSRITGDVKRDRKTIPIYSLWQWPDDGPAFPGELIHVAVAEFEDVPGAWNGFFGMTDEEGRLRIPLAPLLDARALVGRRTPLHLTVACPRRNLEVHVALPYDIIAHFAQQWRR